MYTYIFYFSASDDNLLKNVELFDKLSLRFGSRFLFIKDVSGSSDICCWSYFGLAVKVAEVCCTSIVYVTDKKTYKGIQIVIHSNIFKNKQFLQNLSNKT